jgi:two-component system, LytTR family, sensor kinase
MFRNTIKINKDIFLSRPVREIFFWIIYLFLFLIFTLIKSPGQIYIPVFLIKNIAPIIFFFINDRFCFPILFVQKKKWLFFAAILVSLFSYLAFRVLLAAQLFPAFFPDFSEIHQARIFLMDHGYMFMLYTLYGLFYWYAKKLIFTEKKLRMSENATLELKNETLQANNDKLQAEYNYLKSQINPHFLYNTLNFFYANTWQNNPDTAQGIALLSEIMRYSLSKGDENGRVSLLKEWQQLENLVTLNQLRYQQDLPVVIEVKGEIRGVNIMPHLLITPVENAFKHGDLRHPLRIHLQVGPQQLDFRVQNHIQQSTRQINEGGGMGLDNLRKRLRHEYADKALLEYQATDNIFTLHLMLPLTGANTVQYPQSHAMPAAV